ncbi:AMP-binding protein OS=Streptomyces microflavus OX=1919 GN=G3I39_16885 PE=4 SV=1 [Streptomyces microflavus]
MSDPAGPAPVYDDTPPGGSVYAAKPCCATPSAPNCTPRRPCCTPSGTP